jgi:hypothetical protein
MNLFAIRRRAARWRGNAGYSLPLLSNSEDVFGDICSEITGFERERRDLYPSSTFRVVSERMRRKAGP